MRIQLLQLDPADFRFIVVLDGDDLAEPLTERSRAGTIKRIGNALALHDVALVKDDTWECHSTADRPDGWIVTIVLTILVDPGRRNLHLPPPVPAGDPVTALLENYIRLAFQPLLAFPDDPL